LRDSFELGFRRFNLKRRVGSDWMPGCGSPFASRLRLWCGLGGWGQSGCHGLDKQRPCGNVAVIRRFLTNPAQALSRRNSEQDTDGRQQADGVATPIQTPRVG
jgi:hypothetical protein